MKWHFEAPKVLVDTNSVYYIRVPTYCNTEKCIVLILNFNIYATYETVLL